MPGSIQRNVNLHYGEKINCYTNPYYKLRSNRWKFKSPACESVSSFNGYCGYPWTTPYGPREIPLQNDNFDKRALEESKLLGIVPINNIYLPTQTESNKYAPSKPINYRLNVCDLEPVPTRALKWKQQCFR
tara:strand:+ start:3753 stop:4145 length:393 start_codon:yes stop_codon:yes gene_type:complete